MTDLAPGLDLAAVAPDAIGSAAAAALLAAPGLRVEPADAGAPAPRPADARAVAADGRGGSRVVLLAAATLARQVQVGPPPAEDLLDATGPVLAAVAAAAGIELAAPATEATADAADAGPGELAVAARLLDGDDHVATIVVLGPAPADAEAGAHEAVPHEFAPLPPTTGPGAATGLELLHDVELGVTAELGRTRMLVKDVLGLAPGSVIELDRAAGAPVDVLVNGTLIARGEVVVIDEEFGIRVTEIVGFQEGHRP